ncbi:MAG: DUF2341 domain-containing protein [Candidatus Dojkabacteria bacterium]|nr:DUF2341 domain-containing protein [Candidatus Dojkabacteria bacterium]
MASNNIKVVILLLLIFFVLIPKEKVNAWIEEGWSFRQRIDINNSGSSLTNFPVKLNIDTQSLILADKMKSDCSDIRITDSSDIEMSFWLEEGCNTSTTYIWTKVPSLPTGDTSIYLYYGNEGATTLSSSDNTFATFNGIETGLDRFSSYSHVPPSTSTNQSNTVKRSGEYSVEYVAATINNESVTISTSRTYSLVKFSVYPTANDKTIDIFLGDPIGSNRIRLHFGDYGEIRYWGDLATYIMDYEANHWYNFEFRTNAGTDRFDLWVNGTLHVTGGENDWPGNGISRITTRMYSPSNTVYMDDIILDQSALSVPTVSVTEPEEYLNRNPQVESISKPIVLSDNEDINLNFQTICSDPQGANDITKVYLYIDMNKNGSPDSSDVYLEITDAAILPELNVIFGDDLLACDPEYEIDIGENLMVNWDITLPASSFQTGSQLLDIYTRCEDSQEASSDWSSFSIDVIVEEKGQGELADTGENVRQVIKIAICFLMICMTPFLSKLLGKSIARVD